MEENIPRKISLPSLSFAQERMNAQADAVKRRTAVVNCIVRCGCSCFSVLMFGVKAQLEDDDGEDDVVVAGLQLGSAVFIAFAVLILFCS